MTNRATMPLKLSASSVLLVAALFASGCAGSREKQPTSVKPTPGKKTETTETNGDTQSTVPSDQSGDEGKKPSTTNDVTDLKIDAELDNGDATNTTTNTPATPSGPWDGKSFRGLGKWKVTPG